MDDLWWDDASYIRYQGDFNDDPPEYPTCDGPTAEELWPHLVDLEPPF